MVGREVDISLGGNVCYIRQMSLIGFTFFFFFSGANPFVLLQIIKCTWHTRAVSPSPSGVIWANELITCQHNTHFAPSHPTPSDSVS